MSKAKLTPDDLRIFKEELERLRIDHADVINAEPQQSVGGPLDGVIRYARKRYEDVKPDYFDGNGDLK
jgi:hypothetical protein